MKKTCHKTGLVVLGMVALAVSGCGTTPSTMVALYRQEDPGLTLAQAEQSVKSFLLIPQDFSLNNLDESTRAPFSHKVFLAQATLHGGVEAYLDQLVQQIGSAPPRAIALATVPGVGLLKSVGEALG
jgi:hypothetical protein